MPCCSQLLGFSFLLSSIDIGHFLLSPAVLPVLLRISALSPIISMAKHIMQLAPDMKKIHIHVIYFSLFFGLLYFPIDMQYQIDIKNIKMQREREILRIPGKLWRKNRKKKIVILVYCMYIPRREYVDFSISFSATGTKLRIDWRISNVGYRYH